MNWPTLAINIVTYNRKEVLRRTLVGLQDHLSYREGRAVIVADDGSTDGTQEMLKDEFPYVELVQSQRSGLGANTNAGLRKCFSFSDVVLQLQDDMELLATLDLYSFVEKLVTDETAGFIRLWGVAGHRYTAELKGQFWHVFWSSPELYIPSDRPHIKHRRFHDAVGFYPEGRRTAETEEAWCHQCKQAVYINPGAPQVIVPLGLDTEKMWEHNAWDSRWRDKGL